MSDDHTYYTVYVYTHIYIYIGRQRRKAIIDIARIISLLISRRFEHKPFPRWRQLNHRKKKVYVCVCVCVIK